MYLWLQPYSPHCLTFYYVVDTGMCNQAHSIPVRTAFRQHTAHCHKFADVHTRPPIQYVYGTGCLLACRLTTLGFLRCDDAMRMLFLECGGLCLTTRPVRRGVCTRKTVLWSRYESMLLISRTEVLFCTTRSMFHSAAVSPPCPHPCLHTSMP